MEWISVKDKLPKDYNRYYAVLITNPCSGCDANIPHLHKLNFVRHQYGIAQWAQKDLNLVKWYQDKGDHSWDHMANDRWASSSYTHEQITYWMPLPEAPKQ